MLQFTGKLKMKGSEQVVSDRFRKREFVIADESSQYPQYVMFQLTQDKCSLIDSANVGDELTVSFNLKGREWKSPQGEIKYFNTLEAWKIDRRSASSQEPASVDEIPASYQNDIPPDVKDDLPF